MATIEQEKNNMALLRLLQRGKVMKREKVREEPGDVLVPWAHFHEPSQWFHRLRAPAITSH